MTMMMGTGPFGEAPAGVFNFEPTPPRGHALYFEDCPRRVRVELAGVTVADSRRVKLMHEARHLPVYYFPDEDVHHELLRPSDHRTRCPFKGEARHYSVAAGGRVAEDAAWAYPKPTDQASWLAGYLAFYWGRMDHWFEEDQEVFVHPRDPYHRVDVLPSSRRVRVRVGEQVIAETHSPRILFETGLPPRHYIDPAAIRADRLSDSDTHTRCPYKGRAIYKHLSVAGARIADAAWVYPEPLPEADRIRGWLCFDDSKEGIELELQ